MTVTAILLSYHREPNIGRIIYALEKQTVPPEEIILINNNPTHHFKNKHVTVINGNKNWGCPIRHAIGLLVGTTHVLFMDDDIMLEHNGIERLIGWSEQLPESIIGWQGRKLRKGDYPYSKAPPKAANTKPLPVDVVMGKLHFCRKEKLVLPFTMMDRLARFDHFSCDDIALCLANELQGHQNYVVPVGAEALDEFGIGLGHAPDWWERRDHAVKVMLGRE